MTSLYVRTCSHRAHYDARSGVRVLPVISGSSTESEQKCQNFQLIKATLPLCGVQRYIQLRLKRGVQVVEDQVVLGGNLRLGLGLEVVVGVDEVSFQRCEGLLCLCPAAECCGVFDSFGRK